MRYLILATECQSNRVELVHRLESAQNGIEDEKTRIRHLSDELANLREQHTALSERRKSLWREDTKLDSLVGHAVDEMKSAERFLAGMMDKDTGMGLRAIDKIAE